MAFAIKKCSYAADPEVRELLLWLGILKQTFVRSEGRIVLEWQNAGDPLISLEKLNAIFIQPSVVKTLSLKYIYTYTRLFTCIYV
jgi:hypothetical protein